jgi:Leucine-rich repeat (LRR) protein
MKNLQSSILQKRKETYLKLQNRFLKSLSKGDFQNKNGRSKHHWIEKLKKLEHQLGLASNLKLKHWALAFALGFVAIAGNAQERPTQEKRFGAFKQNKEIRSTQSASKDSNSSARSQAVSIFSEQPVLGDGLLSDRRYVGDFDGDSDLDLIMFAYYSAAKMFVNDGAGDIRTQNEIWTPSYGVDHILMGDFDGDGDLDFVVLEENNSNQSRFNYLINDGSGNFIATNSAFGPENRFLDKGDFDGDGDLDILTREDIGGYVYEAKILSNSGTGTSFTTGTALAFLPNTDLMRVGDFTGDAFLDITIIDQDTIKVYLNDQSGGFTEPSVVKTLITGASYTYVRLGGIADTDADGDIDVVASIIDNLWHFENDGTGRFTQTTIEQNVDANLQVNYDNDFVISNLDANGGSEIIIGKDIQNISLNTNIDENILWINDGANVFTESSQLLNFTNNPSDDAEATIIDFDGDGDNDIVLASYIDMELFANDGTANFTSFDDQIVDVIYSPDFDLLDLDGDSDLDVIMSYTNGTLINDGTGNFSKGPEISVTHGTYYLTTGDYDNDGDSDVIFADGDLEHQFHVWNNDGTGNFTAGSTFAAADSDDRIQGIATGDMNGDGFVDVVTVTSNDITTIDNINIWTNNGSGSFTESSSPATNKIRGLVLTDIDGDSDLDVITRAEFSYVSVGLAKYTNTAGSLSATGLITPANPSFEFNESSFQVKDMDNDGDADIVVIDRNPIPSDVNFFTNDGTANFTASIIATTTAESIPILEDFDLDGDIDIFINGGEYNDQFIQNDGAGAFSVVGSLDSKSYGAVAGDIDGDGDKDLFTLQYYQGNRFIINNTNMPVISIVADSAQLVTVYDETGGDSWTNNTNWKTGDVSTWFGVTVANNRVTSLALPNNNITGAFTVNSGLDSLATLNLSGNLLTGIPDFSLANHITTIDVSNNQLEFGSLEANVGVAGINYANQGTIGTASTPAVLAGDDFVLSITTSGTANSYQWFKNGSPITGATNNTHTLSAIDITDVADYHCEVNSSIVTGLTLTTELTSLSIESVLGLDSVQLVTLYDETGGDSWTNNTNWKTGDVSTWSGVTVTNDRVSSLILANNNLTGVISAKSNLDSLTTLDLSGNLLTEIPDFTTNSISTIDVSNNQLEFGTLEANAGIPGIDYSNQATIGTASSAAALAGDDFVLSITTSGTANSYQWFKNSSPITGAINNTHTLNAIDITDEADYYCEVTNSIVTGLTLTTEITSLSIESVLGLDSAQLVTLYDETGGDTWTDNTNWKTGDVSTWFGVTVVNDRVSTVILENNNLTGAISVDTGLDSLITLDVSGNLLTAIPDLAGTSITTLDFSENQLEFGSLEPNAAIPGIDYSNQANIGSASTPAALAGDDFVLSITTSGTANSYQWFKNSSPITGAINNTHTVSTIDITDEADYHCEVTNSIVTGLTLTTEITTLSIQSVLELDSTQLVTLYDETGGDTWTDNTNWKTSDVSTWFGVTVVNGRVSTVLLENNNLAGEISVNTALDSLVTLDVSGNLLTAIPDLSGTTINTLDFSDNKLEFGSLEPNAAIPGIDYSNQATIGIASTETVSARSDFPVSITTSGTANQYQWFKDDAIITGAISSEYNITSINTADIGDYHCEVTNTIVTGLTLTTEVTTIKAQASISGTIFLDANTALDNGEVMLLRITNTDGYDTTSVINVANDGTYTHPNAALGQYITLAQADLTAFPDHLPTYWGEEINSILWEEAGIITLDSTTVGVDVILEGVPDEKPAGEGLISGILEEEIPEGGRLEAKRRVGGAGVSVRRGRRSGKSEDTDLELVDYVYTNDEGEFKFENLENDVYTFNVQYPGYPMDTDSNLEIDVNQSQPEAQVTAIVAEGVISVAIVNITALGSLPDYVNVELYPNPTGELLFINELNTLGNNYTVSIFNSIGKEVLQENYDVAKHQGINVGHLDAGVYIVHLENPMKKDSILKTFRVIIEK